MHPIPVDRDLTRFSPCVNSRNWQLAVPKLIFFIVGFPGLALFTAFTGVSLHFVWWLADVVMWGIGFYSE